MARRLVTRRLVVLGLGQTLVGMASSTAAARASGLLSQSLIGDAIAMFREQLLVGLLPNPAAPIVCAASVVVSSAASNDTLESILRTEQAQRPITTMLDVVEALRRAAQDDYWSSRVSLVDGWVLAHTEVAALAWAGPTSQS